MISALKNFTAGVTQLALGCGISQAFGLTKLMLFDGPKYLLQARRQGSTAELKRERRWRAIKADLACLVPLFGSILGARVHDGQKGRQLLQLPSTEDLKGALAQGTDLAPGIAKGMLLGGRHVFRPIDNLAIEAFKNNLDPDKAEVERVEIPVAITDEEPRNLEAVYVTGPEKNRPLVVLFGGNLCNALGLEGTAIQYYDKGYNVLMVTRGGYLNTDTIATSEATMYQDVAAVKAYINSLGYPSAGYHGQSLGAVEATAAAVHKDGVQLGTDFVVVDRAFTDAADSCERVAGNDLSRVFKPMGRAAGKTATPKGLRVQLPSGDTVTTDGMDNRRKLQILAETDIPVVCIMGENDAIMGAGDHNFATDLNRAAGEKNAVITNIPETFEFFGMGTVVPDSHDADLSDDTMKSIMEAIGSTEVSTSLLLDDDDN